jgi:hypothetical protein
MLLDDPTLKRRESKLYEVTPELITEGCRERPVMLARRAATVAIWRELGKSPENLARVAEDEQRAAEWEIADPETRGPRPPVRVPLSLVGIGQIFGQDHTTVMHALDVSDCLEGSVARRTLRRRRARAAAKAKKSKMKGKK